MLLEPSEEYYVIDHNSADGTAPPPAKSRWILAPAHARHGRRQRHYDHARWLPVFKAAVKGMADVSYDIMQQNNLALKTRGWCRTKPGAIIDATQRRISLPAEKVINIQKYKLPPPIAPARLGIHKAGDNIILAPSVVHVGSRTSTAYNS